MPELLESASAHEMPMLSDKDRKRADGLQLVKPRPAKLSPKAVRFQQVVGSLKFVERLHPRLSLLLHRLSCVMSSPPDEALDLAFLALRMAYAERNVGITYGGAEKSGQPAGSTMHVKIKGCVELTEQASEELQGHADATWGDRNMYGLVILYANAAIFHVTKKLGLIVDSSMEAEGVATSKVAEQISYVREILRAFGVPQQGPTFVGTDNTANQRVASGASAPSRSKHFLRRYHVLLERVRSQEIKIEHVPDKSMPADFLTKWIGASKLNISVEHVTNARHV